MDVPLALVSELEQDWSYKHDMEMLGFSSTQYFASIQQLPSSPGYEPSTSVSYTTDLAASTTTTQPEAGHQWKMGQYQLFYHLDMIDMVEKRDEGLDQIEIASETILDICQRLEHCLVGKNEQVGWFWLWYIYIWINYIKLYKFFINIIILFL